MGRRKFLPVSRFQLVGGALCLELVNTSGARAADRPRERLASYQDLLTWSRRAGILRPAAADRLRRQAARGPAGATRALRRVRRLREQLYRVFRPIADGSAPPPMAVGLVSRWWRKDRSRRELVAGRGGFDLRLRVRADERDPMLWPIVASAVDLLTSERIARLKRCGECDWLFLDESKNGSRRWCKKNCGNRVRARRRYARSRR